MTELQIIHSVPTLSLTDGGPSYTVTASAAAQQQTGRADVCILTLDQEPQSRIPQPADVEIVGVAGGFWAVWGFRKALTERPGGPPRILHDHGIWHPLNLGVTSAARSRAIPYLVSPHGMLEPWALSHRGIRKQLVRWVCQDRLISGAKALVASSELELQGIRAAGIRNPVAVIPHGVELPPTLTRADPERPRIALFLSRIHPKKGLQHAIQAWAALKPVGWELRIVGPGDPTYIESLRSLVSGLGMSEAIRFFPPMFGIDKARCFRNADLFLLPTYSENFGLVVVEALVSGVPVITTVATPWKQMVDAGCGWVVEVGTEPLIPALRTALSMDAVALREMGEKGRVWASRNFRWDSNAASHLALYDWVIGRGARPEFVDV